MKILILLTSHRHNDEYKLYGLYLEKCIQLSNMVDIYIHSNCINTNFIDNIAFIKCKKKNIIITEKNAGFINGGLEAVSDIIDLLKLYSENCEYDYVIHMHPDVFIINETLIVNFLNDQKSISEIIFYVNLF